jgi:MFS transporter, DHA2 family, multidrug resistance protein
MRRYLLLFVMSACFASIALDNSKLVAALPALARVSQASPELQRWIVEASLLVYASLLLIGGSLSERFGPRRMLLSGLLGFGLASVAGALSPSLSWLIAARALSGASSACVTPAALATIKHTFGESERPRALAIWTASFGIGAALGPVLAGLLVSHGGLSAVLLANLPPLALCFCGSSRLVSPDLPRRAVPLDWAGAALCLATAGSFLFALLSGPTHGWFAPEVVLSGLASGVLAALAVFSLRGAENPLFDLSLLAELRFSRALLVILLGYFAFSGVSYVVAQYLQIARALPAFDAGLLSLPLSGSMLLGTLAAPRSITRFGLERALSLSLGLASLGAVLLAFASSAESDLLLCLALLPFGAGLGNSFAIATELALGSVAHERAPTAAAISESAFEFGGVLGVAVLSTLLGAVSVTRQSLVVSAPHALWAGAISVSCALVVAISLSARRRRNASASRSAYCGR